MTVYKTVTPPMVERALLEERSIVGANSNAFMFPKWRVSAWKPDGSMALADATNPAFQKIAGVSYENIPANGRGLFVHDGVLKGALAGLGAAPGDTIYLAIPAGQMTKTIPVGDGVAVIQIGFAVENADTGLVHDLRIEIQAGGAGGGSGGVTPTEVQEIIEASKIQSYCSGETTNILAFRAVAWGDDQKIVGGDAADADRADILGITVAVIQPDEFGPVQTTGTIQNAAASLSAQAGQPVFLAEGAGGGMTLTAPASESSAITRLGYAVPRTGTSGSATDLQLDIQRLFIP